MRSLRLWGAQWSDPTDAILPADEANRLLAAGHAAEALALVDAGDPPYLWALIALGGSDALDAAVSARLARDDLHDLRLAMRDHAETLGPIVAPQLGDGFPSFFASAFGVAIRYHADEPDVARALLDPALDRGRLVDTDAVLLGALRAERLADAGQSARARREADRVVRDANPHDPEQRAALHRALIASARASMALGAADVDATLARAAAVAPSPELHTFLVRRHFVGK